MRSQAIAFADCFHNFNGRCECVMKTFNTQVFGIVGKCFKSTTSYAVMMTCGPKTQINYECAKRRSVRNLKCSASKRKNAHRKSGKLHIMSLAFSIGTLVLMQLKRFKIFDEPVFRFL